ncbi:MAG: hypothetical protein AAB224_08875 [Gemmatimonadota bacterium]
MPPDCDGLPPPELPLVELPEEEPDDPPLPYEELEDELLAMAPEALVPVRRNDTPASP